MNPFDPYPIDPPVTSPYIQAIVGLLHAAKQQPSASIPSPRHYGPPEGPLGENAHLGWGQTKANTRTAAPTPRTKLGGYLGGTRAPKIPQAAVAAVLRSLLAGSTPRYF